VPLEDRRGDAVDGLAVADVAELPLAAELLRERPQQRLATREQDDVPAAAAQLARGRLADPRRGAGDDGYALNVRTVSTLISTVSSIGSA
jgi:hypothetical protein